MDRRGPAVAALMVFVVATVVATVLDGRLPASEESVAGWVLQALGYLAAVTGGVLLLSAPEDSGTRRSGAVVLGATALLVLSDVGSLASDGAAIGLGLVRLVCLVVLALVTASLARAVAAARR